VVGVLSDDAAAAVDVPAWCQMRGHEYLGADPATPDPATPHPASLYTVRLGTLN
jgi:TusA-related sulfurtransferase